MSGFSPSIGRRRFLGAVAGGVAAAASPTVLGATGAARKPNVLFIMTDQQRADTIAALGNSLIHTPNMDRLVQRGLAFTRAYSTCPVCVPARYTIRTGCEPHTTAIYQNGPAQPVDGQASGMEERCGTYLARTMAQLGYRTFGIGKFHTNPPFEDIGYQVHLHSHELYGSPEMREKDSYAQFIAREHPHFNFIEDFMGERSAMYYIPQMSPLPAELGVEAWAADRAVELIRQADDRPYFGFVSFIGPHPPIAPPIPFNRMYDPDRMSNPVRGDLAIDHMDEQIAWMNHAVWAEDVNDSLARQLKARYYGELTYIDQCLGKILDAVESRDDADNTVICFYSDHGDHLGDHHAWQKESYFEASCHVPFLVSWPERLPAGVQRDELICLTDLFGIATTAAGSRDLRQGIDVLGLLDGSAPTRDHLIGLYGTPGSRLFKVMVRDNDWKYVYFANGGRELLFHVTEDPLELRQRTADSPDVAARLRRVAVAAVNRPNANRALNTEGDLLAFPFEARPLRRILQFDGSRGIRGFPDHPGDLLA